MQIEKGIKLLKRVWKALLYAELTVLMGVILFLFSHYFSYSVFVSNLPGLHHQATAATSVQPR